MAETAGNIVPIDRGSRNVVAKEEYVQAIQLWCQTRDTAEALTREEIGSLQKSDRLDAQRKAIILALAHYYRQHERADVGPGVAVILTLLSDNDKGAATISQEKLAKLFGRSRSAIADAQGRLRTDGIIVTGRGCKAGIVPIIPRIVTRQYNHLTWLIDAVCAQDASQNCPASPYNSELSGQSLQFGELSGQTLQLPAPNCSVEGDGIVRPDRHNFTMENSERENARARDDKVAGITKVATVLAASLAVATPLAAHTAPQTSPVVSQKETTQDGVTVGSDGLYFRGFGKSISVDYASIDYWATLEMVSPERARGIVEADMRGWIINGTIPDRPANWLRAQLKHNKTRDQIGDIRVENERKRGTAPPQQRFMSRDDEAADRAARLRALREQQK